jgi:pyrroloquinoline quinone biosynthesis protein D
MNPSGSDLSAALEERPRLSAKARVQPDRLSGKPALLYPEGVLLLNPTGAAIVGLCDGTRTVREIVTTLAQQYNAPVDLLTTDVLAYIARLKEKRLLADTQDDPTE